ncbi:MAG: hypothetical protein MI717_10445 [Spirochaetales bacterium]|nr:hypothetical protein [Spirochaetales bacterium]
MKKTGLICLLVFLLVPTLYTFANGEDEGAATGELTVWCWDPNFNGYSMKQAAAVYTAQNPDATINVVDIPENIEAKIEAGLQAGGVGLPDISLFQDFIIEKFLQNYPGSFVDLKAEGIDYSQFAPYKVGPMSEGESTYGIPFDTGATGFFLRTEVLEAAGLAPEDFYEGMTWAEVIALGEVVKAKTGKALIAYDNTSFDFLRIMVQSTGEQFFRADGTVDYDTPAIKKSLGILKEMNEKGLLYMAEGWNNWIAAYNGVDDVDAAGFINGVWIVGTLKSQPENAGKWMVAPTPRLDGFEKGRNASNNGGSSWYVFSTTKAKTLAVDFLQNTWAGTSPEALDFYNRILKDAGAMGTFLPSREGSNYQAEDAFFYGSQPVFKDFSNWMAQVPVLKYTPNYSAMRIALNNAMQLMYAGDLASVDDVVAAAATEYSQISGN